MNLKKLFVFLVFCFAITGIFAQNKTLIISKIATPPVIDGLGTDAIWSAQPRNTAEMALGVTTNFSGSFKMCYDDNNIYILVSVTDPTPNNNGTSTWQSDCVEMFFAMDVTNAEAYRAGDCSIRKLASKTQANGGVEINNNTALTSDANLKIAQTNGAEYVQEWQIPISSLKSTSAYNGKSFRFDIQLSDNDGTGNQRTGQLFWNSNADDQWTRVFNQGIVELSSAYSGLNEAIGTGAEWKYFKGTGNPGAGWNLVSFADTSWINGSAPFRYGDGAGGTELTDMQTRYSTLYLRKKFEVIVPDTMIDAVIFNLSYDDGFRMYVNDKAVLSKNAAASDEFNQIASGNITDYGIESVKLSASEANIKNGENTIAVVAYNVDLSTSTDFYFDLSTSIVKKEASLPKAPEVIFSSPGGYYSMPFDLTLSSPNVGDTIIYTIDCSDPEKSVTIKSGKSPLKIGINPANMQGRPNTPAVVIRAVVKKTGYSSRNSETRTYIFPDKIKTQKYPGSPWPNGNVNDQVLEYKVDSALAHSTNYTSVFETAMKSIPSVSLVTSNDNLFNPLTGIYVNAMNHGEVWERPASLELIETNNNQEFATNIGLRIRGGWSRHGEFAKHAFRIFYRGEYGKKKLDYPLFGSEGADEFDKFDLRCAQNYSWSMYSDPRLTYAQDEFFRDAQGITGHPYTRSKYCHLFLNGLYWGLFEFQERPESNFASSYKGGKKENYDVIKVDVGGTNSMEATDGDMLMYQKLLDITKKGFVNNDNYYKIQGLQSDGAVDTTIQALLDVDNMIDYLLNIFYSGNFDSPLSSYKDNNGANNYYAIKNKKHKRQGFFFIVHDAEHTMVHEVRGEPTSGLNENRVSLEQIGMSATFSIGNFTPHQMHYKLKDNAEYRMRFVDHVYKTFYNDGVFTPSTAKTNFIKRANQIDKAIIGESVRWGHGYLTREKHWIPAINNTVTNFINKRTPIVLDQLDNADLLPSLLPASVYVNDNIFTGSEVFLVGAANVKLVDASASGTILYTLDGSDPRLPGGAMNPNAVVLNNGSGFDISYPLRLKTRVLNGTEWSPVREILFTNTENRENIRITEIQYNPKDFNAAKSKDMEFIEFKNIGDKGIDLGGCKIDSAVNFTFPKGTIVNPNGFVVVASDRNDFEYTYWKAPTGVFKGNLSNEGERIVLFDENNEKLIDVKYGITDPWPIKPNGSGFSLVARDMNPGKNEAEAEYWRGSRIINGSPFADDSTYTPPVVPVKTERIFCQFYPNPVQEQLFIKLSDNSPVNVQITDISGRQVHKNSYSNSNGLVSVNFSKMGIKAGVYLVNIKTQNNQWQKKVVYQE